jgi:hypothetical protein
MALNCLLQIEVGVGGDLQAGQNFRLNDLGVFHFN